MKQKRLSHALFIFLGVAAIIGSAMLPLHAGAKMEKPEKIEKQKILDYNPEWKKGYLMCRVDYSFVDTLRTKMGKNVTVDVYLGLWCKDSRVNVPQFIKIVDVIQSSDLKVNYYTVTRKPDKNVKYYVRDREVDRVPTFIFMREGKEIGRIVENPDKNMVEDVLGIVF